MFYFLFIFGSFCSVLDLYIHYLTCSTLAMWYSAFSIPTCFMHQKHNLLTSIISLFFFRLFPVQGSFSSICPHSNYLHVSTLSQGEPQHLQLPSFCQLLCLQTHTFPIEEHHRGLYPHPSFLHCTTQTSSTRQTPGINTRMIL